MKLATILIPFLCLISGIQCKKDKESELDKLPPIIQSGANTFGCLINGIAYMPKGNKGNMPNFYVIVDPGYSEGDISIRTYRIEGNLYQRLTINSDNVKRVGNYLLGYSYNKRDVKDISKETRKGFQ